MFLQSFPLSFFTSINALSPLSVEDWFHRGQLYIFTEGDGRVSVCATILTPLNQLAAPTALIVFAIYTIEGTAHSKLASNLGDISL